MLKGSYLTAGLIALLLSAVLTTMPFDRVAAQTTLNVSIVNGAAEKGGNAYLPNPIIVSQGSIVTWINEDTQAHTVTRGSGGAGSVAGGFDSGSIAPGGTYSYAFYQSGEFPYYCTLHPTMAGKVIVTASTTTVTYIYASMDRSAYNLGESVTVKGNVPDPNVNNLITFSVTDAQSRVISTQQVAAKADGSFNYGFTIPRQGASSGQWTMTVAYGSLKTTLPFRVNPSNLPISVGASELVDILGNRVSDLKAGQQAVLEVTATNTASTQRQMVLIMQIIAKDGSTEHLTWLSTTASANQQIKAGFGWVPSGPGSFTVKTFVWESFKNPVALSELSESIVNVG